MADNPSLKANFSGKINQATDTIRIGLPQGTNLSSLTPTIEYDGASISPANKTASNFSSNLQYTVTAQDGSTRSYVVVVNLLSGANAITAFAFLAANNPNLAGDDTGIIHYDTIRVHVDPGTELTNLVPTISYAGTQINPGSGVAQNFTSPVHYVVTAQDGTIANYIVIVSYDVAVYFGSNDNYLYALDAATGVLLWKAATGGPINSSPTVAGSQVYVGSDDRYLYAFSATTGALRWKAINGGPLQSNPTVAAGMVYVSNNSVGGANLDLSELTAFDTATGTQQWQNVTPSSFIPQSPTVSNGVVYGTYNYVVGAFDARTGINLWNLDTANYLWNPAIVGSTMYIGNDWHPLSAVDLQTHTVKWEYIEGNPSNNYNFGIGSNGSPTVDGANVFVPIVNNDLYAIDTLGNLVWKFSLANGINPLSLGLFSSPVAGGGLLFASNTDGVIYAMNETTGLVKWQYGAKVGTFEYISEPTFANGTLYCGTANTLYAVDANTGVLKWTFTTGGGITHGPCIIDANGNVAHPGSSGDNQ